MKFIKSKIGIRFFCALLLVFLFLSPGIASAEVLGDFGGGQGVSSSGWFSNLIGKMLSPFTGAAEWAANAVISTVLMLFFALSGILLTWAMACVDLATSSVLLDEVFFSDAALAGINTGWGLVRDFVNMFFILILVFLAIATILRINKFSDKRLLFFVIFAALLVNFSKPITIFVIDVSNLAMTFFIDNIQSANVSYSTTLLKNMDFKDALWADIKGGDMEIARYIGLIVGAAFKFILAVMLFVLALSLVIRIVALWVLIILSPLAFFGIALPGTFLSALKDGWVKKLVYWCFFGPVLLFFLWLSLVMVDAITTTVNTPGLQKELKFEGLDFGEATKTFVVGAMKITIPYVAAIYMLFYGYSLTKSMSAGVGNSVLGLMNKGQGFMSRWGKRGAAVAGTLATGGLGYLGYKNYQAAKTGLQERETGAPIALTKADKEKKQKKRVANWAGRSQQFESGEVNEQLKEWDEKGAPTEDQLREQMSKGNKAAALKLANEGKLSVERGDYGYAMELLKNNPKLAQRFQASAKKKNLHAKLEYDIGQAISRDEAQKQRQLSSTEKQDIRAKTYRNAIEKIDLAQIAEQDLGFHKSEDFQRIMKERVAAGKETIQKLKDVKMSGEKKDVWSEARYFAPGGADLTAQEERDAMRNMNS